MLKDAMWSGLPLIEQIELRYKMLADYAKLAATCIDDLSLSTRSFHQHLPYYHLAGSRHWGRELWVLFDRLPREYRDMVNNDPGDTELNLKAAVELWKAQVKEAEDNMDFIIRYEATLQLPDWLQTLPSAEFELIKKLASRRKENALYKKASALLEFSKEVDYLKHDTYYSYTTANRGVALSRVDFIDPRGMRPHEYRELMAKSEPLRFETKRYMAPKGTEVMSEADASRIPPAKIHPTQFARGKNG